MLTSLIELGQDQGTVGETHVFMDGGANGETLHAAVRTAARQLFPRTSWPMSRSASARRPLPEVCWSCERGVWVRKGDLSENL